MLVNLASGYGGGAKGLASEHPMLLNPKQSGNGEVNNKGGKILIDIDSLTNDAKRGVLKVGQKAYKGGNVDIYIKDLQNSGYRS